MGQAVGTLWDDRDTLLPILLEFSIERLPVEAQKLGGARAIPAGTLHDLQDIGALQLSQRKAPRRRVRQSRHRAARFPNTRWEVFGTDFHTGGERRRPL